MAFNANTLWEVRTTGNDANGGGFHFTSTGTDYSNQNSPQVVYTDLVIGATTTQITSVANPFGAVHVGNIINIISGTGFTAGRYQIVSVNVTTHVATMDRAVGTAASVAGAGNLGGALATVQAAFTDANVTGNKIYIQAGTYTQTAFLVLNFSVVVIGYSVARNDNLAGTIITTATSSIDLIHLATTVNVSHVNFINIAFTNTASTKGVGIVNTPSTIGLALLNCSFSGFTAAISQSGAYTFIQASNCSFIGMSAYGIDIAITTNPGAFNIDCCYFYGCATAGINIVGSPFIVMNIKNTVIAGCGIGINVSAASTLQLLVENCTVANNTSTGIALGGLWNPEVTVSSNYMILRSCIIYGNGAFGISAPSGITLPGQFFFATNAVGANTSGNYSGFTSIGDVALTAIPFNGSTDFSLNSTAGGGALCKGAGFPGTFPGGTTQGHMDIGAVQSSGSGTISNYGYTG